MHALMLHNRYLWYGGEDLSFAMEIDLLRRHGWDVTPYEEINQRVESLGLLRTAARTIWSLESYRRVRSALRAKRYDIVHVQNFFPLISPSVYYAARAERVPVVQTLRNYRLLCPASTLMRNGQICESCMGRSFAWPGVVFACYRNSRPGTAVVAAMTSAHRALGTWERMVDAYIALTQFGRDKFIKGGLPANKIFVKPNYLDPDPLPGKGSGGYALFVGRLDEQKGIRNLLDAWQRPGPRLTLRIVGDGPLAQLVAAVAERRTNVEWLGRRPAGETLDLIGDAAVLLVTSESYEGQPRVIIESFAKGTPVMASGIGAMAEMIEDGKSGMLFRPRDTAELAKCADWAATNPDALHRMRRHTRAKFETEFTANRNYGMLMDIYEAARRCSARAVLQGKESEGS